MRLQLVGSHIVLEDSGVSLGGNAILRGLDIEVAPGEVIGIAGPNGSGKTTLLRLLATLLVPDMGRGSVLGATLGSSQVFDIRRRIGLISHIPSVIGELTLRENLEHAARLVGVGPGRVETALRVVGLDAAGHRRGSDSSFGMLRRTEAARLLMTKPHLLYLDEAFSGLDVDARDLIDALIGRTVDAGGAVVIVSHDPGHLSHRAGRVLSLSSGRLEPMT
jgi:ABC-type multidrug transport system ATPase subunit